MATLSLRLDPNGIKRGAAVAEDALEDVAAKAKRTESAVDQMAKTTSRGAAMGGNSLKALAQQGSQVVDMGLATGQWGKAFFLQMGDIAGAVGGPLTIALGSAIGVLGTLGLSFLNVGGDADEMSDSIDEAAASLEEYSAIAARVKGQRDSIFPDASKLISQTSQASQDLLAISKIEAFQAIDKMNESLSNSISSMLDLQGRVADVGDMFNIETQLRGNITVWEENREHASELLELFEQLGSGGTLQESYNAAVALRDEFKLHVDVQGEMEDAQLAFWKELSRSIELMEILGASASDVGESVDSAAERQAELNRRSFAARASYVNTRIEAGKLSEEIGSAAVNALALAGIDITSGVSSAAKEAAILAANLGISLNAALSLQNLQGSKVYSGRGSGLEYTQPEGTGKPLVTLPEDTAGASAANAAAREAEAAADAYDRLIGSMNPLTAASLQYAQAQETINNALKTGHISADEAGKTMEEVTRQYEMAKSGLDDFADAGGSAIDRLIDGSLSLKEALVQVVLEFAKARLAANVLQASGGATSSLGGFLLNSVFGGFFDNGGVLPTGKTGIVGEYGPERITSTSRGTVVTSRANTAREMSGGGVSGRIDVGVSVDDDGKIQAYVRNASIQAAQAGRAGAVQDVKTNLNSWNQALQQDGALA